MVHYRAIAGATLLLLSLGVGASHASGDTVRSFDLRLDNLERAVNRLSRDFKEPVAVIRDNPLETRLIEARILFEVGNYENAAVVLLDLVETKEFQTKPEFGESQLMLGQAMRELGNRRSSSRYLRRAAKAPQLNVKEEAFFHLVDMALESNDDNELSKVLDFVSEGTSAKVQYVSAKGHIRLNEYDKAARLLANILSDPDLGVRARYYDAVTKTALKQYDAALQAFESLTDLEDEEPEVAAQALLGVGRLKMELGDLDGATFAYQRVARDSQAYGTALYEMSWSYIKAEQYDMALATVDTLLLTARDPELEMQGYTLRGRLNIFLNDYDSAVDSFESIVNRFSPLRNELSKFMSDQGNISKYFDWLLERRVSDMVMDAPLTARTADWVESSGDMERVAELFDNLSLQRREVQEAQALASELEEIVKAQNRVELFPKLKDGWTRALALQNQLLLLASNIVEKEQSMARPQLIGESREQLNQLVTWRRKLEERFRDLPMTFDQYEDRERRVDERFVDLKRQAFILAQRLKEVRKTVIALERYVDDQRFKDGTPRFSEAEESDLRDSLFQEKGSLRSLMDELSDLEGELQTGANTVGTGDEATQEESNLKVSLISAYKRESNFYDRLSAAPETRDGDTFQALSEVLERIWTSIEALDSIVKAIDGEVDGKVAELYGLIRKEAEHLDEYVVEMAQQDSEGRAIGLELGRNLFQLAQQRMDDFVLKAEVGLIDVAWQQKQQVTEAVKELENQKASRLGKLTQALRQLTEGEDESL